MTIQSPSPYDPPETTPAADHDEAVEYEGPDDFPLFTGFGDFVRTHPSVPRDPSRWCLRPYVRWNGQTIMLETIDLSLDTSREELLTELGPCIPPPNNPNIKPTYYVRAHHRNADGKGWSKMVTQRAVPRSDDGRFAIQPWKMPSPPAAAGLAEHLQWRTENQGRVLRAQRDALAQEPFPGDAAAPLGGFEPEPPADLFDDPADMEPVRRPMVRPDVPPRRYEDRFSVADPREHAPHAARGPNTGTMMPPGAVWTGSEWLSPPPGGPWAWDHARGAWLPVTTPAAPPPPPATATLWKPILFIVR
jgi:hypothetical protein